jgi:glycosyltransferase involved in cell wall biosynthesis
MKLQHSIKVLHINYYEDVGGASKSMTRLVESMNKHTDAHCDVMNFYSSVDNKYKLDIFEIFLFKIKLTIEKCLKRLLFGRLSRLFSTNITPIHIFGKKINTKGYDLLHLHWVANSMLDIEEISSFNIPIVWTLHDFYPITGGCHVLHGCEQIDVGCASCPVLNNTTFITKREVKKKIRLNKGKDIYFIAPSSWVKKKAVKSFVFKQANSTVKVIPNIINNIVFNSKSRKYDNSYKRELELASSLPVITYGAVGALSDENKGFKLLYEALSILKETTQFNLLVFGDDIVCEDFNSLGITVKNMGYINSEAELAKIYKLSDVVVVPSKEETFGQVALEAIACGTPVVVYKGSGMDDIVEHKISGYMSSRFDVHDYCRGILWALAHKKNIKPSMKFDERRVANEMYSFYSNILS